MDDFDFDSFLSDLKTDLDGDGFDWDAPASPEPEPQRPTSSAPVSAAPARPASQTPAPAPQPASRKAPQQAPKRTATATRACCPKCGSSEVSFQALANVKEKRKKGVLYWLFIGWWWEIIAWCVFGIFKLLHVIFSKKTRTVTKIETWGVCQSCGYRWKA